MDYYDEILEYSNMNGNPSNYILLLTNLINNKSEQLTQIQFKNCLILILAIRNPRFIDSYFTKGKRVNKLDKSQKQLLIEVLKSEFGD